MDETEIAQRAVAHFRSGFNCAESVLLAMEEAYGIHSNVIPRIATPFGAGIGRRGSICGALTGAVMAVGLRHGRMVPKDEARERPYKLAIALYNDFEDEFSTVLCYELTGCDLTTEEGRKKHVRANCERFVSGAVGILLDLAEIGD